MTRLELLRVAVLVVPGVALWAATRRAPRSHRERGALLLAGVAAFLGLGVLHELADAAGWWRHLDVAGSWRGFPVDLWLGWAVLWGPVPVALRRHVRLPVAVLAAAWLDVVAMPWMSPLVELRPGWLAGEVLGLAGVLVPSVLLGRWTAEVRRLGARTALQVVVFTGLVFWLLPTTAFTFGDGSWSHLLGLSAAELAVVLQIAALVALPGLAAVCELAERGGGTPFPWDPPARLVTTGPYAYLANPMQLAVAVQVVGLAALTRSWSLAGAAAGAIAFSATVAESHEREHLHRRFGSAFDRYRAEVPTWRPRWRPFASTPATLFLARDCAMCRQLGDVVAAAGPIALARADARRHPGELARMRYEAGDGTADDGLPALARALERLNLAAAILGWGLRLPLLRHAFQLIADTVAPPLPARSPRR